MNSLKGLGMHYTGQDMLWLIGSLSRVFRIPFDPQLILQQFPPPYSRTALLNALQALDLKVGEMELDEEGIATLERTPFPVVAFVREDEAKEPDSSLPPRPQAGEGWGEGFSGRGARGRGERPRPAQAAARTRWATMLRTSS
ncbi:MAG: hypothetical protein IPM27_01425 [Nitrosomonadales bacterium]|nr:hypothetical protein [Nitrosomonadales bacterium]